MAGKTKTIDQSSAKARLETLQCQWHSLDVALLEAHRTRFINRKDYKARAAYLGQLQSRLEGLKQILDFKNSEPENNETGIPNLDHCNAEEIRACQDFIDRRIQFAHGLYEKLGTVFQWVTQSYYGKGRGLFASFRLSKIRKWLHLIENESMRADLEEKDLEQTTQKIASRIETQHDVRHLGGNLEALMKMFREVEVLNNRITGLHQALERNEAESQQYNEWLAKHETKAHPVSATQAPSPQALHAAKDHISNLLMKDTQETETRLTLARRFAASCPETESAPLTPAPASPAGSSRKRRKGGHTHVHS